MSSDPGTLIGLRVPVVGQALKPFLFQALATGGSIERPPTTEKRMRRLYKKLTLSLIHI